MFLNCSTCFERHTAHHQELKNCNCSLWIYIVCDCRQLSWLSGNCFERHTAHNQELKNCNCSLWFYIVCGCRQLSWLSGKYVKPDAAITVFELLMMSGVSLETVTTQPWQLPAITNYVKPEAAITVFELLMMSGVSLETVTTQPWQLPATTNYVKPEAAITVFELLMMSGLSPETCWAIKKHWNNKFHYTVASCWLFLYDSYHDARIHEHQTLHLSVGKCKKVTSIHCLTYFTVVLGHSLRHLA
jgi:hypothetical protein